MHPSDPEEDHLLTEAAFGLPTDDLTSPRIQSARRIVEEHLKEPQLCWETVNDPLHQRAFPASPWGANGPIKVLDLLIGAHQAYWTLSIQQHGKVIPDHFCTAHGQLPLT